MDLSEENWADLVDQYTSLAEVKKALNEKSNSLRAGSPLRNFKGFPPVQETLDLHGLSGKEAERLIHSFLRGTLGRKLRTVRLIPGKGLHSKNKQAVLPKIVEKVLLELKHSKKILGSHWERHGGAVLVYLP